MSPLEIEICLHYHSRVDDHPWLSSGAPIVPQVFGGMMENGLLVKCSANPNRCYEPTGKLHAYAHMLCDTPLPERAWVDKRTNSVVQTL
jgi:hypothetical protein